MKQFNDYYDVVYDESGEKKWRITLATLNVQLLRVKHTRIDV